MQNNREVINNLLEKPDLNDAEKAQLANATEALISGRISSPEHGANDIELLFKLLDRHVISSSLKPKFYSLIAWDFNGLQINGEDKTLLSNLAAAGRFYDISALMDVPERIFFDMEFNPNQTVTYQGQEMPLLQMAVVAGNSHLVQQLITHGANPHIDENILKKALSEMHPIDQADIEKLFNNVKKLERNFTEEVVPMLKSRIDEEIKPGLIAAAQEYRNNVDPLKNEKKEIEQRYNDAVASAKERTSDALLIYNQTLENAKGTGDEELIASVKESHKAAMNEIENDLKAAKDNKESSIQRVDGQIKELKEQHNNTIDDLLSDGVMMVLKNVSEEHYGKEATEKLGAAFVEDKDGVIQFKDGIKLNCVEEFFKATLPAILEAIFQIVFLDNELSYKDTFKLIKFEKTANAIYDNMKNTKEFKEIVGPLIGDKVKDAFDKGDLSLSQDKVATNKSLPNAKISDQGVSR